MSQENVERTLEAVEAINRGEIAAAFELAHPDIEWQTLDVFPDAGIYRGPDEVRGFFQTWQETFRGFRLQLEECVPVGDDGVLAALRVGGEGTESGVEVESPLFFQMLEFRDGQLIRARMFQTRNEALEAAGLSE
jgi:ketosteroid isomerase-like protein